MFVEKAENKRKRGRGWPIFKKWKEADVIHAFEISKLECKGILMDTFWCLQDKNKLEPWSLDLLFCNSN